MVLFGLLFEKRAPHKINSYFGYRTSRSMKNEETWKFAHLTLGKIWYTWGMVMFVITLALVGSFFFINKTKVELVSIVAICIQSVAIFFTIYLVEKALKDNFDKEGIRK
jgi:uncharacterized membrane protein